MADELRSQFPININTCVYKTVGKLLHPACPVRTVLICAAAMDVACGRFPLTNAKEDPMSCEQSCAVPSSPAWQRWCHHSTCGMVCEQRASSSYPMVRFSVWILENFGFPNPVATPALITTTGHAAAVLDDGSAVTGRCVVACDGMRSAIATQLGAPSLRFSGQAAYRYAGYPTRITVLFIHFGVGYNHTKPGALRTFQRGSRCLRPRRGRCMEQACGLA